MSVVESGSLSSPRKTCNFSQKPRLVHIRDLSPAASSSHSRSCSTVFLMGSGSPACHKPRRILSPNDLIKRPWWQGLVLELVKVQGGEKETGQQSRRSPSTASDSLLFRPEAPPYPCLVTVRPSIAFVPRQVSWPFCSARQCARLSTSRHPGLHRRHRYMDGLDDRLLLHGLGPSGDLNPSTPRQTGGQS